LPKQSVSHRCPFIFKKSSHAGLIGNDYADALAKNQSQPTLKLRIRLSQQLALREIPSTTSTGLKNNMKNTESYKITQT
jgi:hypothetical protein